MPFLYPLQHRVWERFYVGSGVLLYDTLGGTARRCPTHRHLTRRQALREFPSLRKDALVGAIQYYDAQVDDARHTMILARTAARLRRAVRHQRPGDRLPARGRAGQPAPGCWTSRPGSGCEVRARQTINATGVWTDEIQELVGGRGQINVRASKGMHLVVPRDRIHARDRAHPAHREERAVRHPVGPALDHRHHRHRLGARPRAPGRQPLGHRLPARARQPVLRTPLTHEDVEGVYAGLRPLLSGESEDTSQLSREHAVVRPVPGLVMVAGGKYTTYRVMAKDAVDAVVARPRRARCRRAAPTASRCVGAEGYAAAVERREQLGRRLRAAPRPGSSTCWAGTARWSARCSRWSRERPDLGRAAGRARRRYLRAEARLRRARTRARCTSTTC